MKKLAKMFGIVLGIAAALAVLGSITYFIALNAQWNSCKKDMAVSFSSGDIQVTYQNQMISIEKDFEQTNIYRELTTGTATGFQKKPASSDTMTFQFGDGSQLTASRLDEKRIQFCYSTNGKTYGFILADSASYENLCAFVSRNVQ